MEVSEYFTEVFCKYLKIKESLATVQITPKSGAYNNPYVYYHHEVGKVN